MTHSALTILTLFYRVRAWPLPEREKEIRKSWSGLFQVRPALIPGITGQDGAYLSELLLEKGYKIHGIIRRASTFNTDRIDHIDEDPHQENARLFLHYGDLTDGTTLGRSLEEVKPIEDDVKAMWLMLQQDAPDDYVAATGETHSVEEFLELAFGYGTLDWRDYVAFDQRYLRPPEVDVLMGDPAKVKLGWEPSVTFEELVRLMVEADMEAVGLVTPNGNGSGSYDRQP